VKFQNFAAPRLKIARRAMVNGAMTSLNKCVVSKVKYDESCDKVEETVAGSNHFYAPLCHSI